MTCDMCREQILPYLYDLLEPLERQQLAAHLENCPSCQETLKAAQDQVGMLVEAVKSEQSDIDFKAPVKATPASTAPTVLMARPPRRFFLLNRWAMAASILLVLMGVGGVIGGSVWRDRTASLTDARSRLAQAHDALSKSQKELDQKREQTQKEIRVIQEQIDEVFNQWRTQESNTRRTLEKERVQIVVNGPRNAQAGVTNRYDIELRQEGANFIGPAGNQRGQIDNKVQQLPGNLPNLQARVINQKNQKVLYEQQLKMQENSRANFDLPTDLPIMPGDEIAIEFQTQMPDGKYVNVRDSLRVVFPEYVTHLATDRPMYRPGETVRFRSLTLERFSLKPAQRDFHLRYRVVGPDNNERYSQEALSQVVSSKDNKPIAGPNGQALRGLGVGEYTLPAELPEGNYTLSVNEVNESFNEEKRTFQVRRLQTPRFNKEVTFHRNAYGPGDQVKVQMRVSPVQGQPATPRPNIQVYAEVKVDSVKVYEQTRDADADGRVEFDFNLPQQIHKGVGTVYIFCVDGVGKDSTVRSIPILLHDLSVDFYPEGGDLIAGVPNRVYFQARTFANKPADFAGVILDDRKQEVARIQTLTDEREPGINQGLGSFTFTPQTKKRYTLRIDSPIGIDRPMQLPIAVNTGVALHLPQGVVDNDIKLTLHSAKEARELLVGAYCRGRMLDFKLVKAQANQPTSVTLKPQVGVGGVFRITVFEKTRDGQNAYFRPLAERLIYRKSQARLDVAIECDRPSYQPGEPVELRFSAKNEKKEYVPAVAMIAVIDNRVNKLVDEKTARAMPTHFLLTTEIRNPEDLENADVLLGNHPKASAALDLLLGCQGWRRFAEQDPKLFAQRQPQDQQKAPIFLSNTAVVPQFLDTEQKQIDKLDQAFVSKAIDLNKQLAEKEKNEVGPPELTKTVETLQIELQHSQNEIELVNQRIGEIRGFLVQFGLGGALLTLLFVGFFLISVGLRRLSEGGNARPWLFAGLALLCLLFLVSVIGTFTLIGEPFMENWRGRENRAFKQVWIAPAPPRDPNADNNKVPLPDPEDEPDPQDVPALPAVPGLKKAAPAWIGQQQQPFMNQAFLNKDNNNEIGFPQVQGIPHEMEDRALRQQGAYQTLLQRQLGRRVQLPPVNDLCTVREYAHQNQQAKDAMHREGADTLYWHPVLILPDGKAKVNFDLADSVARYDVAVLSYTLDGRLGANFAEIVSRLPFTFEPKAPVEVTESDRIGIPVAVTNGTSNVATGAWSARAKGLTLEDSAERNLTLKANESRREMYHVKPSIKEGEASFRVAGKASGRGDAVERKFNVVPDGFPVVGSIGGILENGSVEHVVDLPDNWLPGSLHLRANFYPSPLAELQSGLEAMQREPTGAFESFSSSNYANVLMLNYMKQTSQINPPNLRAEKNARQQLQLGNQKLMAFECVDPANSNLKSGYEWFGGIAPPNEALTAYGLLQFGDMTKLERVDDDLLRRTERFLLEARDGNGGFKRNPRALDPFGRAPDAVTNAYIVWALTESGVKENLDPDLAVLREQCKVQKDPYFLSLVALSHLNRKKTLEGAEILRQVHTFQDKSGEVSGARTSITGSQGRDLAVETTALAILGWHKAERPDDFNTNLKNAVRWLAQQRQGSGGFGGTQATILALKALIENDRKNPRVVQGGQVAMEFRTLVGGPPGGEFNRPVGQGPVDPSRASFTSRTQETITLNLFEPSVLAPGKNLIHLNVAGLNTMPYTLSWSYRTPRPANDPAAPVKLTAKLGAAEAKEGDVVKLNAVVQNASGNGQGMTVAILGLPAGLALPENTEQLKALAQPKGNKPGKISAWELRGRDLVLYWRDLAPNERIVLDLDVVCRLPGFYRGPASRAYLYYDAERKFWIDPMDIRILEAK